MTKLFNNKSLTLSVLVAGACLASMTALASEKVAAVQTLQLQGRAPIAALANGLSLYSFDPDIGNAKPACNAVCAEKWPPVIIENEKDIQGNPRLGSITRESGLQQLTIDEKPVYTYYFDRHLGDVKGDGLGYVWHLVEM